MGARDPQTVRSGLRAELHETVESLDPWLDGWRDLAARLALPYSSPEWMLAFWQHRHARGAHLHAVTVCDAQERLVGVLPFYLERRRARPPVLWLLASGIGQRTSPLAVPGREAEVAAAAAPLLGRGLPASVVLPAMPESVWPEVLAHEVGAVRSPRRWQASGGLLVDLAADHESWLAVRSRTFRKKRVRRLRDLAAAGLTLRQSTDDSLAEDLAATFRLHRLRFATEGRRSSLTADVEAAVRHAATAMLARGTCVHLVLDGPEGAVGGDLYFVAGERMCGWNGGFDPSWAHVSPGTCLLDEAIRVAHERGLGVLDLGAGEQAFKRRFATREESLEWTQVVLRPAMARVLDAERALRTARTRARALLARWSPAASVAAERTLEVAALV